MHLHFSSDYDAPAKASAIRRAFRTWAICVTFPGGPPVELAFNDIAVEPLKDVGDIVHLRGSDTEDRTKSVTVSVVIPHSDPNWDTLTLTYL